MKRKTIQKTISAADTAEQFLVARYGVDIEKARMANQVECGATSPEQVGEWLFTPLAKLDSKFFRELADAIDLVKAKGGRQYLDFQSVDKEREGLALLKRTDLYMTVAEIAQWLGYKRDMDHLRRLIKEMGVRYKPGKRGASNSGK